VCYPWVGSGNWLGLGKGGVERGEGRDEGVVGAGLGWGWDLDVQKVYC